LYPIERSLLAGLAGAGMARLARYHWVKWATFVSRVLE
jgi:hypothetical protein